MSPFLPSYPVLPLRDTPLSVNTMRTPLAPAHSQDFCFTPTLGKQPRWLSLELSFPVEDLAQTMVTSCPSFYHLLLR